MLSKILSKKECAGCKFCCIFECASIWEAPLFSCEQKEMLEKKYPEIKLIQSGLMYTIELSGKYLTDDPGEVIPCPFLSDSNGCVLNSEEKSFDCKIWPFRVMKKDSGLVIALTPTCSAVNKYTPEFLRDFLINEGLDKVIFEYARTMPGIIKEYREGFPVLVSHKPI